MGTKNIKHLGQRKWRVEVDITCKALKFSAARIREVSRAVLCAMDSEIRPTFLNELTVLVVSDLRITELNASHRGKLKPTDVLSFPTFEPEEICGKYPIFDTFQRSIGDLVISAETTLRQAREFRVAPEREFVRLVVHGILHLCGYDHEGVSAAEAQRMRRKEQRIRKLVEGSFDGTAVKIKGVRLAATRKTSRKPLSKRSRT